MMVYWWEYEIITRMMRLLAVFSRFSLYDGWEILFFLLFIRLFSHIYRDFVVMVQDYGDHWRLLPSRLLREMTSCKSYGFKCNTDTTESLSLPLGQSLSWLCSILRWLQAPTHAFCENTCPSILVFPPFCHWLITISFSGFLCSYLSVRSSYRSIDKLNFDIPMLDAVPLQREGLAANLNSN